MEYHRWKQAAIAGFIYGNLRSKGFEKKFMLESEEIKIGS
jgi:hypothetical protein